MTETEQRPALGIVTIPKDEWREGYNKKFLEDWENDPYEALSKLLSFNYFEFSRGGHGSEYWTHMDDLPEIVDTQQLAEMVVKWLTLHPINSVEGLQNHNYGYEICLSCRHEDIKDWSLENIEKILCVWEDMRKNIIPSYRNLLEDLSLQLVHSASGSTRASSKAELFAKFWTEYGDKCNFSVFSVAYFRNGKWQEEAHYEVSKYAKRLRRKLKVGIDDYSSCKQLIKKRPDRLPKAIEELRDDLFKDLKFFIHNMLIQEHPELKDSLQLFEIAEKRAKHYRVDLPFPI